MRLHLALLLSLSVSSLAGIASAADDGIAPKKNSFKMEKLDETPCTCVFNKNRVWNPEKILWNDQYWHCSHYREDGTCKEVAILPDEKPTGKDKPRVEYALTEEPEKPIPGVFHKKNRMWTPEKVRFKDKEWQCASYSDDGLCLAVEEVVEQPDPLEFGGVTFAGLDRLYSCEAFGDKQLRNKLTLAEFNRFLALAKERKMWNDTDIKAIQTGEILVGMSSCGAVSLMGYAKNGGGYINDKGEQEGWAEYEYRSAMIMVDYHNHIITDFQVLGEMQ